MKKIKKTKKGFTLIELIAVIAILAILGAVLVPRIAGYQAKAERSNIQSGAKTIVHAIQAYNADKRNENAGPVTQGNRVKDTDTVAAAVGVVNGEITGNDVISTDDRTYEMLEELSVEELVAVSHGEFVVNDGDVEVTDDSFSIND
jgi:prepilin-type N-terminal cleavage/methylation domain-containing protein